MRLLPAAAMAILLVGCSIRLELVLFNNSSKVVVAHLERGSVTMATGAFGRFFYPGEIERWKLKLTTSNCDYTYDVPRSLEHYPWPLRRGEDFKAQLEPDFSIYLLPPTATGTSVVADFPAWQQDGFPLHPVSSTCH